MRTILAILIMVIPAFANDGKYTEAMTRNIEMVYKAATAEELLQSVNAFDRIGNTEKSKWEPFYYASFGYVMLATRENDPIKKDGYLDQAKVEIEKAAGLKTDESEIVAMEGFINMIRVTVDPATRGQQYSSKAMQSFSKALGLNPENPRALGLLAQMQFGTARFFNATTADACGTATKAMEKFGTYTSENTLAPVWGKSMVEGLLKQCR